MSEFIYDNESKKFGDLGPLLAAEIRARVETFCSNLEQSLEGIRATVVGASQYTIQLSGSTIYVSPLDALPLRNVPVIAPELPLDDEVIDFPRWRVRSRPCCSGSTLAAAKSRLRCSCRGAAQRRSSGSTHSAAARSKDGATASRTITRSFSPAMVTWVACSAFTCAKK